MFFSRFKLLMTVFLLTTPLRGGFLTTPDRGRLYFANLIKSYTFFEGQTNDEMSKVYKKFVERFRTYVISQLRHIAIVHDRMTIPGVHIPKSWYVATSMGLSGMEIVYVKFKRDDKEDMVSRMSQEEMNFFETYKFHQEVQRLDIKGELFQKIGFLLEINDVMWSLQGKYRMDRKDEDLAIYNDLFLSDKNSSAYLMTETSYTSTLWHFGATFYRSRQHENELFYFHLKERLRIVAHFAQALKTLGLGFRHCNVGPMSLLFKQITRSEASLRMKNRQEKMTVIKFGNDYFRPFLGGFEHMRQKDQRCYKNPKATRLLDVDFSVNGQITTSDVFNLGWTVLINEYQMWTGIDVIGVFYQMNLMFEQGYTYAHILKQHLLKNKLVVKMMMTLRDVENFRFLFLNRVTEVLDFDCNGFSFGDIGRELFMSQDVKVSAAAMLIGLRQTMILEISYFLDKDRELQKKVLTEQLKSKQKDIRMSIYILEQSEMGKLMKSKLMEDLRKLTRLHFNIKKQYQNYFDLIIEMTNIHYKARITASDLKVKASNSLLTLHRDDLENYRRIVGIDDIQFQGLKFPSDEFYNKISKQVRQYLVI